MADVSFASWYEYRTHLTRHRTHALSRLFLAHRGVVIGSSCLLAAVLVNAAKTISENTAAGKCFLTANTVSLNCRALTASSSSSSVWPTSEP